MTKQDPVTGRFTAERTTTTVTERVTVEPAGEVPWSPEAWARLTAPLGTSPPVIFTPAERAACDAYIDETRAAQADDRATVDVWCAEAWHATFGPLDAWLRGLRQYRQFGDTVEDAAAVLALGRPDMTP